MYKRQVLASNVLYVIIVENVLPVLGSSRIQKRMEDMRVKHMLVRTTPDYLWLPSPLRAPASAGQLGPLCVLSAAAAHPGAPDPQVGPNCNLGEMQ